MICPVMQKIIEADGYFIGRNLACQGYILDDQVPDEVIGMDFKSTYGFPACFMEVLKALST
jgi:hypothetical protein